jgi:hypothetical protein
MKGAFHMKRILKRIFSFTLILVFALSWSSTTFASEPVALDVAYSAMSSKELAYCDIDAVPEKWKEAVLVARDEIIYSESWMVDGYSGYIEDVRTGEVIRTLPSFSELFPNWNLPAHDVVNKEDYSTLSLPFAKDYSLTALDPYKWIRISNPRHYIPAAVSGVIAPAMDTFYVDPYEIGTRVRTYATSLTSSQTCNIGYRNATTGTSLGYATQLGLYEAYVAYDVEEIELEVRVSTDSIPGWGNFEIEGAYRFILVK